MDFAELERKVMEDKPQTLAFAVLGEKLAAERESSEISVARAARQIGATSTAIRNIESGRAAPSLPQLELLSALYRVPISRFLYEENDPQPRNPIEPDKFVAFIDLRNRIIAATLRQSRQKQELSMKKLAELSGMSVSTVRKYESGSLPVPASALASLCANLGLEFESLLSPLNSIPSQPADETPATDEGGETMLPDELREFVANPINQPYLILARRLSEIDARKLRSIAEDLLEIAP